MNDPNQKGFALPLTWKRLDTHHACIHDANGVFVVNRVRDVPAENFRPALWITDAVNSGPELRRALEETLDAFRVCIGDAAFAEFRTGNPAIAGAFQTLERCQS